jgi:hypothetical protein
MAHSVSDSCRRGAPVINQSDNHKTTREMSRQQTINDVESKHKTAILFISCCHLQAETDHQTDCH